MRPNIAVAALVVVLAGCLRTAPSGEPVTFEQQAFATMSAAQVVIEEGRAAIEAGQVPASVAPTLNRFVDSYNNARSVILAWQAADHAEGGDAVLRALNALQSAWLAWTTAQGATP